MHSEYKALKSKKPAPDVNMPAREQEAAQHNRMAGLAIALLLFVFILYIATYARLGT